MPAPTAVEDVAGRRDLAKRPGKRAYIAERDVRFTILQRSPRSSGYAGDRPPSPLAYRGRDVRPDGLAHDAKTAATCAVRDTKEISV